MAHALYKEGDFTLLDISGKPRKGTLNELEGRFVYIDMLDKYNNINAKNIHSQKNMC